MEIAPVLINPGILEYDDNRRRQIERYKEAVHKKKFLNNEQRRKWERMAYLLSTPELQQAAQLILQEDVQRLKMQGKLEKLRSNKEK